jgi:hypothetical protein
VADDNQLGDIRLFFHIEFKEPLSKEIRLQKYRNQEAVIEKYPTRDMWLIFSDGSKARFHFRWEGRKEYGTKRQ